MKKNKTIMYKTLIKHYPYISVNIKLSEAVFVTFSYTCTRWIIVSVITTCKGQIAKKAMLHWAMNSRWLCSTCLEFRQTEIFE